MAEENQVDFSLYIVIKGKVELFVETPRSEEDFLTIFKNVKPGNCFGEINFFTQTARNHSARSSDYTTLIVIRNEDFRGYYFIFII